MAKVARNMTKEELRASTLSDIFLNGLVRRKIPNSRVMPFIPNSYWTEFVFQCPTMSIVSNVFFNDIVLEKNNYIKGWKFYSIIMLEEHVISPIIFLLSGVLSEDSYVIQTLKYIVLR